MAALAGCGIHNALVDVDGPEVPILDGSAAQFVSGILDRGVQELEAPVRAIRILEEIEVSDGSGTARLSPSDNFEINFEIFHKSIRLFLCDAFKMRRTILASVFFCCLASFC